MKTILHNLKHFFITAMILVSLLVLFGLYIGAEAHGSEDAKAYQLGEEGPHVFFEQDFMSINYIKGTQAEGFSIDETKRSLSERPKLNVHFALEGSHFEVELNPDIQIPPAVYRDQQPIVAISDVESGFKAFRDFLITHEVIDTNLSWTFGQGHLVLVGDFVDRGASTTQVLWFIYKLEQEAKRHGGTVHFVLGNHEIKNLQGNFQAASEKYFYVAGMLGKQEAELYGPDALLGRWLESKNTMEVINEILFVHGGIHPDIGSFDYSIETMNEMVRKNYRKVYFPKTVPDDEAFLQSTETGPSWYRGYIKGNLSIEEVRRGLKPFGAKAAVVGHTIQWHVKKLHDGLVYAIDVKQPNDYQTELPRRSSEGLLIEAGQFYRLKSNGSRKLL